MKRRPVRIAVRQGVFAREIPCRAKTIDITKQETYLSICENCHDIDEQDLRLVEIATRYRINVFEHIQHSDALEDIIFERV
ncbi:MAG: hypothetical protein ACL7BU_05975 [Candidatus Phlomobacter fragariae]